MTKPLITRDDIVERAQLLDAEYSVLSLYDTERSALGHDYGNGQRYHELLRLRRELERVRNRGASYGIAYVDMSATPEQTIAAFRTIALKRTRRYSKSAHRPATAERAITAWRAVARELESVSS